MGASPVTVTVSIGSRAHAGAITASAAGEAGKKKQAAVMDRKIGTLEQMPCNILQNFAKRELTHCQNIKILILLIYFQTRDSSALVRDGGAIQLQRSQRRLMQVLFIGGQASRR